MKISGIYSITCLTNNKKYIGSSVDIERRWYEHKMSLGYNKHRNQHLQNAWNKYGENQFVFQVVEQVEIELLLDAEQKYLNDFKINKNNYFNISEESDRITHSEETKNKMSLAKLGANNPQYGKPLPESHRQKIREAQLIKTIYVFVHEETNQEFTGTPSEFIKAIGVKPCGVSSLINKKQKYHYGWRLK